MYCKAKTYWVTWHAPFTATVLLEISTEADATATNSINKNAGTIIFLAAELSKHKRGRKRERKGLVKSPTDSLLISPCQKSHEFVKSIVLACWFAEFPS